MALGKSSEVVRCDIFNTPFVNYARGNMPGGYEVTQPLRREWVYLVVVGRHHSASTLMPAVASTDALTNHAALTM
ncbi:hypothetical protein NL355_22205, partial [Klebsiella pneumoniae]|nr:hypothetical protein [Klebsiella pneumoniae]